jgi:poly(A) polymerase
MNEKVYTRAEHKLNIDAIDPDALDVMGRLQKNGYVAYLVGGSVRDLLLGHPPKDYDISTSARPEEIRALFRNAILIGRRFRLAHIRFGKKVFEVSTFRSGNTEADTLIVRDNEWGTPEQDALRRDFTINGLFYEPSTQTIIDYVDGFPDIQKRHLRTIGQPFLRFKQDPVRMIRLLKFRARFGFTIDPDARTALIDCRGEILKSSQARVFEELLRMLESSASEAFFKLMTEGGLLQLLFPALSEFLETGDGNEIYSFLQEADRCMKDESIDRSVLLSCLLYPFLDRHIDVQFLQRDKIPHLGEIFQETHSIINEAFKPFFVVPRRIRVALMTILSSQYRLVPLEKKRMPKFRIPRDPDFALAVKFLELRSRLEPGLKKLCEEWTSHLGSAPPAPELPRRRSRRRR